MYNTSVADVHLISVSYSSMYKVGTLKFRNWVTYTTGHSYKHWFTLNIEQYISLYWLFIRTWTIGPRQLSIQWHVEMFWYHFSLPDTDCDTWTNTWRADTEYWSNSSASKNKKTKYIYIYIFKSCILLTAVCLLTLLYDLDQVKPFAKTWTNPHREWMP